MSFSVFKKGICPICGIKGKDHNNTCKKKGQLYFCRASLLNPSIQPPPGFKLLGEDASGTWAKWLEVGEEAFSDDAREQWREQQRLRLAKEEQQRKEWLGQLLSVEDRDKNYRFISAKLGLTSQHKKKLQTDRGLTLEEINFAYEQGWIRSWNPGQSMFGVSPALAGVKTTGIEPKLLGVPGIAIASLNGRNQILGYQIGADDREKFPKYLWLSSKNKGGNSPHLPSGELPLFVWKHPEAKEIKQSWLIEGCLKSLIVALKLWFRYDRKDIQIVGAPGGQFCGSKRMLQGELSNQISNRIVLCPDAGSVENGNIFKRYEETIEFVSASGYSVDVAWWEQLSKEKDPDIDELDDLSSFGFIAPGEFFNLRKVDEDSEDWAWKNWLKSRTFTPNITVDLKDFHFPQIPKENAIIAVQSGLGTNKTGAMIEVMRLSGNRSFLNGYRNNLLLQSGARAASRGVILYHLSQDGGIFLVKDVHTGLMFCTDSIHHVDGYFDGVDLYLDESVSVLLHTVNGGTLLENQAKAIKIVTKAFNECNRLFLLDGNQSDLCTDFVASLAPQKQVVKIQNTRKVAPHKFIIVDGVDAEKEVKKRDKSSLVNLMSADDVIPWIACDSKELTDILHILLRSKGKLNGLLVNRDTVGEENVKSFLTDIDNYILTKKPDYVILSPSGESGLSCTVKGYFSHKFSIFNGILGSNSQYQMTMRLRDDTIPHFIFCPERSPIRDNSNPKNYAVKAFARQLEDRILHSAILASQEDSNSTRVLEVIGKAIARSNDKWWEFSCQLGALDNFEKNNLRRCLIHILQNAGHQVEIQNWEIDEESKQLEKWAKEENRKQNALALFQAKKYDTVDQARKVARSNPGKKEIHRRIEKTFLLDRLPQIEESPIWSCHFLEEYYFKDKDFINKQQRYWFLTHFAISKKKNEVDWYYAATQENFYLARVKKNSHLRLWALQQLNILQFTSGEWHKDCPQVNELVQKVRKDKDLLNALGTGPKAETADGREKMEFICSLMDSIGLPLKCQNRKLVNGVRYRVYSVDEATKHNSARLEILAAIERKYSGYLESESVKKVHWEEEVINSPVQAETLNSDSVASISSSEAAAAVLRGATTWEDITLPQQEQELDAGWQLLTLEEQKRLQQLYQTWQAKLEISSIASEAELSQANYIDSIVENPATTEQIQQVDAEIRRVTPLCNLDELPQTDLWIRRLNRALQMGASVAESVYRLLPPEILDSVWRSLTGGVQKAYCQIFATG